jgi:hypothetical protein
MVKAEKNKGPQPKHRFSSHVFALGLTFLFLFVFSPTSFCRLRLPFASIFLAFGWVSASSTDVFANIFEIFTTFLIGSESIRPIGNKL